MKTKVLAVIKELFNMNYVPMRDIDVYIRKNFRGRGNSIITNRRDGNVVCVHIEPSEYDVSKITSNNNDDYPVKYTFTSNGGNAIRLSIETHRTIFMTNTTIIMDIECNDTKDLYVELDEYMKMYVRHNRDYIH